MSRLEEQIAKAKNAGIRTVGEVLREVARAYPQTAELIEQDLENEGMSLAKCYEALYAHAKKHATGGSWACGVFGIDPENEAVKVILDFYKISLDVPKAQALGHDPGSDVIDLFDFL